jgi:hypothetical protein
MFNPDYVRKVLKDVQYKGFVRHKENVYKGEHDAIIDEATWNSAQKVFAPNADHSQRYATRSPAMLKGLLGCGMTPTSSNNHGRYSGAGSRKSQTMGKRTDGR